MRRTHAAVRERQPSRWLALTLLALTLAFAALTASTASAKSVGQWTDADVSAGVQKAINYLFSQIDDSVPTQAHWDADTAPAIANTGFAIAATGSALKQGQATLTPSQQTQLGAAIKWLIGQQASGGATDGAWGLSDSVSNYETSISLMALSFFSTAQGAGGAITKGRNFEIKWQNAPQSVTGNAGNGCVAQTVSSYGNCGSWTYQPSSACGTGGCGDGSNTGFGITGLDFSGGVPAGTAAQNLKWARATQEIASNPFATLKDGGGSYEPGETYTPFRSNANDTGTILFSFAYDGAAGTDPTVLAAEKLGTDVLDTYELDKTNRTGIYHDPPSPFGEDGSCKVGALGCDWFNTGDGGYHYSLFALSKGFGSFTPPNIAGVNNFYAKVVDLLLSEQAVDGSWPNDSRDDGSTIGATAFAVLALTKAGQTQANQPAAPPPAPNPPAAKPPAPKVGVAGVRRACVTKAFTVKLRVATSGSLAVKRVTIKLDGKKVKTIHKSSFRLKIHTRKLKAGRHRLTITAVDAAGGVTTKRRTFSVCKAAKPRRKAAPRFTG